MNKTYKLDQSPLYRLRNRKKLAKLLNLESSYFNIKHQYEYYLFSEEKPSGGERHFANPLGRLKVIQRRIHILLQRIETPIWLKSGKRRESYVTNGQYHVEADYVRTMDISQFYDSVSRDRVFKLFSETLKMADDIATIMTNLVMDGSTLPTGAPSSLLIAFWAYKDMFEEINRVAEEFNCKFSLYVDDMTFSSADPIPYSLREDVEKVLHANGLHSNKSKDRYYKKNDYKTVTGYGFINGKSLAQNRIKKEILELYRQQKKGKGINKKVLAGKLNSARQNEPNLFPTIRT